MASNNEAAFKNYWSVIVRAGQAATRDELVSLLQAESDALDEGALATMRLLASGSLPMEKAFTTLDSAKGVGMRHLTTRSAAARAGMEYDMILNRPDPGHVSYYLRSKRHSTAIVSFHLIDHNRLAVFVAANAPTRSGIRGFGDVYYDCIWLDGLRDEVIGSLESYASSLARGTPDHSLTRPFFEFISSAIFLLLSGPKPQEVIFIPHKLLHMLPLHAISYEQNGSRTYLHDKVRSIHYASSFADLAFGRVSFPAEQPQQKREPRFLSVLDTEAGLPGVQLEEKCIEVYRQQLEPQGVAVDVVTDPVQLPSSYRDYIWANWSSHARSSPSNWGESFLALKNHRITASMIASAWQFDLHPVVVLAACESSIDTSGGLHSDEYCGLDLAFRIAGARATIASLWPVEDLVAALTAMVVPAWMFQSELSPADSVTALQRQLCAGTWKEFLLSETQLQSLPSSMAGALREAQEPFHKMADNAFGSEKAWAAFRSHGN